MVKAVEVFIKAPDIQYCNNIEIRLGLPFSEVIFEDSDFDLATKITALKFLAGFNDVNDVDIFLDKELIKKEEILFWNEKINFENYIKKNKSKMAKINKYTIEFINSDNFEYCKHLLIYTQKTEGDFTELRNTIEKWKNNSK